jgi:hypothetical protein
MSWLMDPQVLKIIGHRLFAELISAKWRQIGWELETCDRGIEHGEIEDPMIDRNFVAREPLEELGQVSEKQP